MSPHSCSSLENGVSKQRKMALERTSSSSSRSINRECARKHPLAMSMSMSMSKSFSLLGLTTERQFCLISLPSSRKRYIKGLRVRTMAVPAVTRFDEMVEGTEQTYYMLREKGSIGKSTMEKRETDSGGEKESSEYDQYIKDFERQLLYWPGSIFPSSKQLLTDSQTNDYILEDALALAKKAVLASKEAASLAQEINLPEEDTAEPLIGLDPPRETEILVRSGKLLERRSKKRGVSKSKVIVHSASHLKLVDMQRKISDGGFDQSDPLRLFLSGSGSRQLLTAKEEVELFAEIQELARLEQVKDKLQSQFGREPTLIEWAEAVGMSCLALQSHVHSGHRSRERMTCSNFRLVVHVAKHYQGWGINLQDLLQEGSKGLMKSIVKFKPQAGCRFATYAYWWIRQSIKKAIFQNSRTIRLPENVYALLRKVKNAKGQCIQDGTEPTKEELARRMGISVDKLTSLLASTRTPLSMQQPVWSDQDTTFQEITCDNSVERPDQCVDKQMMRRHVRNYLNILPPKERRIIRLRFGIEDGEQKSLSQIGLVFGISKERVRQLESRALDKLRRSFSTQGLEAYSNLLV